MNVEQELRQRSGGRCELCGSAEQPAVYAVPPAEEESADRAILACLTCRQQLEESATPDPNHWRCLNDSMWSTVPAVQVVAWRMLDRLRAEGWPAQLIDMLYLDDATLAWAKAGRQAEAAVPHLDSNGQVLEAGDTVVLIQDLKVKGGNFTAKRGTAVRRISLVPDNPEHIEGRVNDQHIVILTKYVKKSK